MSEPEKDNLAKRAAPFEQPRIARPRPSSTALSGAWQAPAGVAAGTWDYVNRDHIGDQYDAFVKDEPLNEIDRKIISRYLPSVESERDHNDPHADRICSAGDRFWLRHRADAVAVGPGWIPRHGGRFVGVHVEKSEQK